MAVPHPKKAIAKLRLTLPTQNSLFALPQSCHAPIEAAGPAFR